MERASACVAREASRVTTGRWGQAGGQGPAGAQGLLLLAGWLAGCAAVEGRLVRRRRRTERRRRREGGGGGCARDQSGDHTRRRRGDGEARGDAGLRGEECKQATEGWGGGSASRPSVVSTRGQGSAASAAAPPLPLPFSCSQARAPAQVRAARETITALLAIAAWSSAPPAIYHPRRPSASSAAIPPTGYHLGIIRPHSRLTLLLTVRLKDHKMIFDGRGVFILVGGGIAKKVKQMLRLSPLLARKFGICREVEQHW